MGWKFVNEVSSGDQNVHWFADSLSDLNWATMNNLLAYGVPWKPNISEHPQVSSLADLPPDERMRPPKPNLSDLPPRERLRPYLSDRDAIIDYHTAPRNSDNERVVVIQVPMSDVMFKDYGRSVQIKDFPIASRIGKVISLKDGLYTREDLLAANVATKEDFKVKGFMYHPFNPAQRSLNPFKYARDMFVNGTVQFGIGENSTYLVVDNRLVEIRGELRAFHDNFDFKSGTISDELNSIVNYFGGPDHPPPSNGIVDMRYYGSGRYDRLHIDDINIGSLRPVRIPLQNGFAEAYLPDNGSNPTQLTQPFHQEVYIFDNNSVPHLTGTIDYYGNFVPVTPPPPPFLPPVQKPSAPGGAPISTPPFIGPQLQGGAGQDSMNGNGHWTPDPTWEQNWGSNEFQFRGDEVSDPVRNMSSISGQAPYDPPYSQISEWEWTDPQFTEFGDTSKTGLRSNRGWSFDPMSIGNRDTAEPRFTGRHGTTLTEKPNFGSWQDFDPSYPTHSFEQDTPDSWMSHIDPIEASGSFLDQRHSKVKPTSALDTLMDFHYQKFIDGMRSTAEISERLQVPFGRMFWPRQ